MLLLTTTSDLIQVVTSGAVSTINVHASWVDITTSLFTPGRTNTLITTATTTTVVGSPGASTQRQVKALVIRNNHASSSNSITVQHYDGATTSELIKYTLLAGETLQYLDGKGFEVIDSSGQILTGPSGSPAGVVPVGGIIMWSGTIATIPATWALCDGSANSPGPDLRDKFIVGATQDDGGVAKTNIRGSLEQSITVTGHGHSAHSNLTHAGGSVGDHTGLTHDLTISNHPDLSHSALTHAATTLSIPDHSIASVTHTHASNANVSVPSGTFASVANISVPSATFNSKTGVTIGNTVTRSVVTTGGLNLTHFSSIQASNQTAPTGSIASAANASGPSGSIPSAANASMPTLSGSHPATTITHATSAVQPGDHGSFVHSGSAFSHVFTAPAGHGTAGTVTHSFTQPSDHTISTHDTVSLIPAFYALAFIQRMS